MGVIYYGAGQWLKENIDDVEKQWGRAECIVDISSEKQGTTYVGYPVISLEEAEHKHPNDTYVVTLSKALLPEVYKYLLEQGINDDRIFVEKAIKNSCHNVNCFFLRNFVVISGHHLAPCSHQFSVPMNSRFLVKTESNDFASEEVVNEYCARRDVELKKLTKFTSRHCSRCNRYLSYKEVGWEEVGIKTVDFATSKQARCNFKCSYCIYRDTLKGGYSEEEEETILKTFRNILKIEGVDNISFTFGEFTILRYCNTIIQEWVESGLGGRINTNASIFRPAIQTLMEKNGVKLVVSLDSGTRETFMRVKGLDLFDKVTDNLRVYSKHGKIILKYILIENENVMENDINEFIRFAKEINAGVCISADFEEKEYPKLSVKQKNAVRIFLDEYRKLKKDLEINIVLYKELQKDNINITGFQIPVYY